MNIQLFTHTPLLPRGVCGGAGCNVKCVAVRKVTNTCLSYLNGTEVSRVT